MSTTIHAHDRNEKSFKNFFFMFLSDVPNFPHVHTYIYYFPHLQTGQISFYAFLFSSPSLPL